MTFEEALDKQVELVAAVGRRPAHLSMGVGLFMEEADISALAADGITEGSKDKKIDFMVNDEDNSRLVFAQGFVADKLRDSAPANKASDLNTASAWLVSGDETKLPDKLRDKILSFRTLLKDGKIDTVDLLYVHNLPESLNVEEELKTVAAHLQNALKDFGVAVKYHELGSARLEHLLSAKDSFIEVTDEVSFPGEIGIEASGEKWKAAVSSVGGTWIQGLFEKYGEKLYSANYRGFLGIHRSRGVNAGIRDTIEKLPEDFWAYNNGITILTKAIQKADTGDVLLKGVSVINGAQTTGTIGEGKADPSKISLLCRIIESGDEETIKRIVRYNNTQNAITSWDQYANDEQQKRLDSEFAELGFAYGRKRGFASAGEQVTIDSVYQPVLAFHGKSRDAVRGKNQLFENVALYENAFGKTKARHILFAYALSRAIDRIRLRLKAEEAEKGELIKLDDKQLRLLRNLNFKPFLIDVVSRLLESICGHKMDVTTVAFKPEIAKKSLTELEALWSPVVDAVLPIVSVRVEPETFFRLHSDAGDVFINGIVDDIAALLSSSGTLAKLHPFCDYVAES